MKSSRHVNRETAIEICDQHRTLSSNFYNAVWRNCSAITLCIYYCICLSKNISYNIRFNVL